MGLIFGVGGTVALTRVVDARDAAIAAAQQDARLEDAVASCRLGGAAGVVLGDGGRSLSLDNKGEEDGRGILYSSVECVLDALEVPDATLEWMVQTTALDGRQQTEWGGVEASWTYHPDRGLDVILTLVDADS